VNDWVRVVVLAVIQGLTEFLPVSSSGHLLIGKELLGLNAPGIRCEVVLHLGTLVAVVAYYRARLTELLRGLLAGSRAAWRMAGMLALSVGPAALVWSVFKDQLDGLFADPRRAAITASGLLLVTGCLLLSVRLARPADSRAVTPFRAWWIGCMQALAILPGISRSGSTILAARHLGIGPSQAAEFSFLMSIPVLLGGALIDFSRGAPEAGGGTLGVPHYLVGACVAAGVGYLAIGTLVRLLCRGRLWYFAVYCLCAGTASLVWLTR